MKVHVFGLCWCLAAGCSTGSSPVSTAKPSAAPPVTVTANRPVLVEQQHTANQSPAPTNTGVNVRDRDSSAKTSFDQNENQADINVTANIRKRLVDTKMSVNAQNVKIVTQNGKVTLRGPVETDDEKQRIEELATAVAGRGNVENQLEVNNP